MKYSEIIKEKYSLKDIDLNIGLRLAELIKKDCQDFLNQSNGGLLYRGVNQRDHDYKNYFKQIIRTNRQPRDTAVSLHKLFISTLAGAGFIANRNNSIFVQGGHTQNLKDEYGEIYIIFPIGSINFTWSPKVKDITLAFDDDDRLYDLFDSGYPEKVLRTKENKTEWLHLYGNKKKIHKPSFSRWVTANYTDKNLAAAIKSKNEIMMSASAVYGIEKDFFNKHVKKYL